MRVRRPARPATGSRGGPAYNRAMLHALNSLSQRLAPSVMERATLLVNHVLGGEPVATARLQPHAGKGVRLVLEGWPSLLPPLPSLVFRITPAGLVEWVAEDGAAELTLRIDASNPALLLTQTATGVRPEAQIEGDAALAADVAWLMENLRWDAAADLERVFPPAVAQQLASLGSMATSALRGALQRLDQVRRRAP